VFAKLDLLPEEIKTPFVLRGETPVAPPPVAIPPAAIPAPKPSAPPPAGA
jgi:hypothetical protein